MSTPAPFAREYEPPPSDPDAQAAVTRAAFAPADAAPRPQTPPRDLTDDLRGLVEPLREAKAAIGGMLRQQGQDGPAAAAAAEPGTTIAGVGVGRAGVSDVPGALTDAAPGTQVLTVYTTEPTTPDRVRSMLAARMGARGAAHIPLQVVHTGTIEAASHTTLERPAPGGVSAHHLRSPAGASAYGTLGCLARGKTAPRHERALVLSANHVLTNNNTGRLNDAILQPAPGDGGSSPAHQIAILERFVPVVAGGWVENFVDCATAWAWPDRVRKEIVYEFAGAKSYFQLGTTPPKFDDPSQIDTGSWVGKSGRTTGLSYSTVHSFGGQASIEGYWDGRPFKSPALFSDVVYIASSSFVPFAEAGDSGAVVFMADGSNRPLGLLIGTTSTNFAVVCRMETILTALDIVLDV